MPIDPSLPWAVYDSLLSSTWQLLCMVFLEKVMENMTDQCIYSKLLSNC